MPNVLESLRDTTPHKDDRNIVTFQIEGYSVLIGRNAYSNERLISEHPHKECLWLHAMAARGSHVVLCVHGREDPPEAVLQYAAKLALENSHSQARTVSISLLRDLFKPDEGKIGVWKSSRQESLEAV